MTFTLATQKGTPVLSPGTVWHNQGVEKDGNGENRRTGGRRRPPKALGEASLSELALRYVSRFATTRAKLLSYLQRKLRERGWEGADEPDIDGLVARVADLGYVDDEAYALAKASSLTARGYGQARVRQALRVAGVDEDDGASARSLARERAADAALRFARRKRIGPFAVSPADPKMREKSLAAMVRAGHDFALARAIVSARPGEDLSPERLLEMQS